MHLNIPLSTTSKHKTFISFHHADDEKRHKFEKEFSQQFDGFVSRSVQDGDIDPNKKTDDIRRIIREKFIKDATVTVVLIGQGTWRRKHVDWEIASSIRNTKNNPRTGLIGILLPSYSASGSSLKKTVDGRKFYNPHTIPPRLYDNVECGFAKIYSWPRSGDELRQWIHDAYLKRDDKTCLPTNRRDSFASNRSEFQKQWQP
ncbi:TIR domain-containing protein [Marinomonas gallaica]|uniref:TIR domain-containing protein n=1 Tax=Marinomonas gallaica TaxID=1806667 RepID=UPI003CE458B3